jgi:ABC-type sugar transport system ATPase subunit
MSTIRLYDVTVSYAEAPLRMSNIREATQGAAHGRQSSHKDLPATSGELEPPRILALDKVNLEIRNGETMGVLGPSGCGKTTLLRAVAGLIPIDSGTITYDDQDMADVPVGERGIGIVFQNYALYPTMNSRENVGFFFRVHHRDAEIPERIRDVSKVMGIGFAELLDKRPAWLSGGQRQRVALARCIARDPKLFLFDEPLSNLDAKLRVKTRGELKRLITRYKITGVYVTHDQTEALSLCDRIAIMNEGRMEQVGTAHYLLEHPISTMVATFLGSPPMNLFKGELSESGWFGRHFYLPLKTPYSRDNVTLGVRSEHLHVDPSGPLRGEITLVEPLLHERAVLAYVELVGEDSRVVAHLPDSMRVRPGDIIALSVSADHVHLFDSITGRRL